MRALQNEPGRRFRTAEEMEAALEALTVLPATAVAARPGATLRAAAPKTVGSTAIEVEPILTPQPRVRTAATHVRPSAPSSRTAVEAAARTDEEEAAPRSSSGALIGSALVILAVVGAIAWRSNARARPVAPVAATSAAAPAAAPAAPAAADGGPVAAPVESNSDAHIQNEIQRLLTSSSQLRSQPIVVEVANGIVTLSGSVNDAVASQLAESFASSARACAASSTPRAFPRRPRARRRPPASGRDGVRGHHAAPASRRWRTRSRGHARAHGEGQARDGSGEHRGRGRCLPGSAPHRPQPPPRPRLRRAGKPPRRPSSPPPVKGLGPRRFLPSRS